MIVLIWQNRSAAQSKYIHAIMCSILSILLPSNDTILQTIDHSPLMNKPYIFSAMQTFHITNFLPFHVNVRIIDSLHL